MIGSVTKPYDGNPATVGNGMMVALAVDSNEMVHKIYVFCVAAPTILHSAPRLRS